MASEGVPISENSLRWGSRHIHSLLWGALGSKWTAEFIILKHSSDCFAHGETSPRIAAFLLGHEK